MHNANLALTLRTRNLEVASLINSSIGIRIRLCIQRIPRKSLLRTQAIARIEVVLLQILIPLLAIQPPHHKRESTDQNGASDAADHASDDFFRVRAQIAAITSCVRERGRNCCGRVSRRRREDVLGGVNGAVDLAMACPGGSKSLVLGGFRNERFAHGGFVRECCRIDGSAANFNDAVIRAFCGLHLGVCCLVGG